MKSGRKWRIGKATIIVILAIALMSTFVFTAYAASSVKTPYSFLFNGISGERTVVGVKGDMDNANTRGRGAVSIKSAQFGSGYVSFWVNDPSALTISKKTSQINYLSDGIPLEYTSLVGITNGTRLTMYCKATSGVQGLGGNFQP